MSPPKHLWSGDWERESASRARELAGGVMPVGAPIDPPAPVIKPPPVNRPAPVEQPASPPRPARPRRARRPLPWRPGRPALLVALGALVLIGVAYGLNALLGSGTSANPAPTAGSASAPWLGVQLESLSTGGVVIATVAPGSPADQAGLEPGDVITEIDGRAVGGLSDISSAIDGMHAGDTVEIEVSRGSTIYKTHARLATRPAAFP